MACTSVTPGRSRLISREIRSIKDCVAARLDPTGSRTVIWNRDSSSFGVKFTPDARNSGTIETITIAQAPTITSRCAIDHSSRRV